MTLKKCDKCEKIATTRDSKKTGRSLGVLWFKHNCGNNFVVKPKEKLNGKVIS